MTVHASLHQAAPRPAARDEARHLRVAARERREVRARLDRRRLRMVSFLTVLALLAGLFGLAVFHAQLATGAYELNDLDLQIAERRVELHELRLEVERLESPKRLRDRAEALGLVAVEPGSVTYLEVDPGVIEALDRPLGTAHEEAAES